MATRSLGLRWPAEVAGPFTGPRHRPVPWPYVGWLKKNDAGPARGGCEVDGWTILARIWRRLTDPRMERGGTRIGRIRADEREDRGLVTTYPEGAPGRHLQFSFLC